jgi:hypothetical protein
MKTALTDTHKKWLLTGALASLLSLNLVMSLATPQAGTTDLASKVISTTVTTPEKQIKFRVKLSADPDGKTRYDYQRAESEAGVGEVALCEACKGYGKLDETFPINDMKKAAAMMEQVRNEIAKKYDKDETALTVTDEDDEAAPAPAAPKKSTKVTKADVSAQDPDEDEGETRVNAKLAEIDKKCADKSGFEKSDCIGMRLANSLIVGSKAGIEQGDALVTWNDKVKKNLIAALSSSNPERRQYAKDLLKHVMRTVDSDRYELVRKNTVLTATQAVADAYSKAKGLASAPNGLNDPQVRYEVDQQLAKARYMRAELSATLGQAIRVDGTNDIRVDGDDQMLVDGFNRPLNTIQKSYDAYKMPDLPPLALSIYKNGLSLDTASTNSTSATGAPGKLKVGVQMKQNNSGSGKTPKYFLPEPQEGVPQAQGTATITRAAGPGMAPTTGRQQILPMGTQISAPGAVQVRQ